ncbi:tetratricopeptide repeat protein [Sulfobacillus thermosulfidooxidans]|uniref:tetratricopeptide repeat protein n=1 Tax=Sulfobacillus thermosulfidooxidans TaxID=28034 RepID=UPI000415B944|nr:tetratricopeptide repeat protein [Sulfobacillus thermosulfidooxidans]
MEDKDIEEKAQQGWTEFHDNPQALRTYFTHLAEAYPDSGRATFELANVLDFLSREHDAIPLYQQAIALGLTPEYEAYAKVQCASSLRNLGRSDEAVALMHEVMTAFPQFPAFAVFMALAQDSQGKPREALQFVLEWIVNQCQSSDLARYHRALTHYVENMGPSGETQAPTYDFRPVRAEEDIPWSLLLLADPSILRIKRYLGKGPCVLAQGQEGTIGVYVLAKTDAKRVELMNIAVHKDWQGHGIGKSLLDHAVQWAREEGYKWMEVGTGNSSLGPLAFYQKAGFRVIDVIPNFFVNDHDPPIIENHIVCQDMIRLRKNLDDA